MPHECTNCGKVFPDGSKEMLSGCPECGGNKFQFRPSGSAAGRSGDSSSETVSSPTSAATGEPASRSRTSRSDPPPEAPTPEADNTRSTGDSDAESTVRGWVKNRIGNRAERSADVGGSDPRTSDIGESDPQTSDIGESVSSSSDVGEVRDSNTATGDSNSVTADSPIETRDPNAEARENTAQASARSDVVSPSELAEAADSAPSSPPSDVDGRVIEPKSDDRPGLHELREELNNQFESIRIINPGQYELNLMELYDRNEYIISLQEDGRYVIEVPDTWNSDEDDG